MHIRRCMEEILKTATQLDENVDVQFREIAHQEAVTLEERDDNVRSIE